MLQRQSGALDPPQDCCTSSLSLSHSLCAYAKSGRSESPRKWLDFGHSKLTHPEQRAVVHFWAIFDRPASARCAQKAALKSTRPAAKIARLSQRTVAAQPDPSLTVQLRWHASALHLRRAALRSSRKGRHGRSRLSLSLSRRVQCATRIRRVAAVAVDDEPPEKKGSGGLVGRRRSAC